MANLISSAWIGYRLHKDALARSIVVMGITRRRNQLGCVANFHYEASAKPESCEFKSYDAFAARRSNGPSFRGNIDP